MPRLASYLCRHHVALLALFLTLGGTSYAAVTLPANSVGARQLKRNAVLSGKIAPSAVTGTQVKDDSLSGADVLESTLGKVPAAVSADNASSAFEAKHANTADSATRASDATHANTADSAGNATTAGNALHASTADSAVNATNATNSGNANALNGHAADGLIRVAQAESAYGVFLTSTETTYGTPLSISAPSQGFVLVTASYQVRTSASCTLCNVFAHIRHVQTGASSHTELDDFSNPNFSQSISLTHVFPVSAGVNTFELRTLATGGSNVINTNSVDLTGLFVPFGPTGGGTLGASN